MRNIVISRYSISGFVGFIFDTDSQNAVESFLLKTNYNQEYTLWFEGEHPNGLYTKVKVIDITNDDGRVVDHIFVIL